MMRDNTKCRFNGTFPEIFDAFQENDDADWWKNKS